MELGSLSLGLGMGMLLATLAAWALVRRHVQRVRVAERRARQAERMAEIGSMTGGLAHEIKNPLSTIGLNAGLLVEGVQDLEIPQDERSRLLNRAKALQRETERLRGILQDFLEFAGQIHLDRRPLDVNELVRELADFYLPEAERHRVRIRTDLSDQPIVAAIDSRAVKQAMLNLMINATQAMAGVEGRGESSAAGQTGDGRVSELILRTRQTMDRELVAGKATPVAEIHVIDTGPGVSEELRGQIFKPYFTTKGGGSGLGLPTSRRLIEEHGGRLILTSEPNVGSDFCVVLPLSVPGAAGAKPSMSAG